MDIGLPPHSLLASVAKLSLRLLLVLYDITCFITLAASVYYMTILYISPSSSLLASVAKLLLHRLLLLYGITISKDELLHCTVIV